jgi:phosphoenolpyruvate carboxykinase (GTP)
VISVNDTAWREELALHDELINKLQQGLPEQLPEAKAGIEKRLAA